MIGTHIDRKRIERVQGPDARLLSNIGAGTRLVDSSGDAGLSLGSNVDHGPALSVPNHELVARLGSDFLGIRSFDKRGRQEIIVPCLYPLFVHMDFARDPARPDPVHPYRIGRRPLEIQAPIRL
jgi:hypothetical protein